MKEKIKDRLRLIMFENKLSQVGFSKAINITPPSLSRMLNTESDPSIATLQKICKTFNLSLSWLMTGVGEKYEKSEEEILIEAEERGNEAEGLKSVQYSRGVNDLLEKIKALEEENERLQSRQETNTSAKTITVAVNNKNEEVILLVDSKTAIHYPDRSNQKEFITSLPAFSLPFTRFRSGSFRAFEIPGEAMSKRINRGDWVVAQRIENFNGIKDSYVYVIVLEDEVVCRRVINRIQERGRLRLKADNPSFSDYEVEIEQVKEVWEVKSVMGFDLSNPDFEIQNWVKQLEDKVFELSDRVEKVEKKR